MSKVCIITGGTSGIGLATARAMHDAGYRVYELSRREVGTDCAVHIQADVTKEDTLRAAVDPKDISSLEAQALLAGIVLDTKNFSIRTSPRTFESAAYLRKAGADPVEVKKLFQTDLDDTLLRYRVIQAARLYRNEIAIACVDEKLTRVIASQAADELINVSGITTSFVLFPDDGQIIISARSIGSCNVQAVLETLGNGGGNGATAGAQIKGKPLQEVLKELIAAIDAFYS